MSKMEQKQSVIRHIVFFSSKDPDDIERIAQGLSILADIPSSSHFEVGRNLNSDGFGNEADLIVYAEFETEADMQAYRDHPLYQDSIKIVRPLRELRIAADFQSVPR